MSELLSNEKRVYYLEQGFTERQIEAILPEKEDYGSDYNYKLEFLTDYVMKEYNPSLFKQYITLFRNSKEVEAYYKKDLYDFNEDEMKTLLKLFRTKTYNAITTKYSALKMYISYAKSVGHKGIQTPPTSLLLKAKDLEELINDFGFASRYCTRKSLENSLQMLINPSDKVIFMLLFEGVNGKAYSDIINLRSEDIDFDNNELTTQSGKVVKFSEFTKSLLMASIEENVYYIYSKSDKGKERCYDLAKSPYIIRMRNPEPMKNSGIKTRLDMLKDYMDTPLLTGKTVYQSGVAEKVIKHEMELGVELTPTQIERYLKSINEKCTVDMVKIVKLIRERMLEESNKDK